jgi:hypothetical protein
MITKVDQYFTFFSTEKNDVGKLFGQKWVGARVWAFYFTNLSGHPGST